jgi:hypothetical protein
LNQPLRPRAALPAVTTPGRARAIVFQKVLRGRGYGVAFRQKKSFVRRQRNSFLLAKKIVGIFHFDNLKGESKQRRGEDEKRLARVSDFYGFSDFFFLQSCCAQKTDA